MSRKIKYRAENAVVVQRYVRMYLAMKKHRPRLGGVGLLARIAAFKVY